VVWCGVWYGPKFIEARTTPHYQQLTRIEDRYNIACNNDFEVRPYQEEYQVVYIAKNTKSRKT